MAETPSWLFPLSSSASIGLIDAYDRPVSASALFLEHPYPPFAAWLVQRGSVTVRLAGDHAPEQTVTARKNQWLILPARPRTHKMSRGTHLLSVRMIMDHVNGFPLLTAKGPICLHRSKIPALEPMASLVAERVSQRRATPSANSSRSLAAELELRAAFLTFINAYIAITLAHGWILPVTGPTSAPVERVVLWIQQQDHSIPLRQAKMARVAGISLSHLKRLFISEFHLTPSAWWQNRRLKEACRLLQDTDVSLKAIAATLAFRFPSHFSIWFRQRTGMSPLKFRQRPAAGV